VHQFDNRKQANNSIFGQVDVALKVHSHQKIIFKNKKIILYSAKFDHLLTMMSSFRATDI
jgi:hypothetical protein